MAPTTQPLTTRRDGVVSTRPKISTHLQLISPKQARAILETETYPQQRPLRPYHIAYLQGLIERGSFRPGTLISFGVIDGTRYLVNGQHTLAALGQTTGGPLWLQEEEIRVETLEEVGMLYESYDRNLARSWADLYNADLQLQQYELIPKHLRLLGNCMSFLAVGFQQTTRFDGRPWLAILKDTSVRFRLMAAWKDEMHNFANGCKGPRSVRSCLERAAVLSVILVTYRYQPEAAHLFWPKVASDSGLEKGMPGHTLLRFLRETTTRRIDPALYCRSVAATWNAAFERRELRSIHACTPGQPMLIQGTPHDGNTHKRYLTDAGKVVQMPIDVEKSDSIGWRGKISSH